MIVYFKDKYGILKNRKSYTNNPFDAITDQLVRDGRRPKIRAGLHDAALPCLYYAGRPVLVLIEKTDE